MFYLLLPHVYLFVTACFIFLLPRVLVLPRVSVFLVSPRVLVLPRVSVYLVTACPGYRVFPCSRVYRMLPVFYRMFPCLPHVLSFPFTACFLFS